MSDPKVTAKLLGVGHVISFRQVRRRGLFFGALTSLLAMVGEPAMCATAAPITVTVWMRPAFVNQEAPVVKNAAATFNRIQRTYKVELYSSNYRDSADWSESVDTRTLPCMIEIDGPFVAKFAWPGYLLALEKFLPPSLYDDLLPSILAQGTYRGHLYSLGQFESGLGLWANRRYLTEAHVRVPSVADPWTLDEFEAAMESLSHIDGVDYPLNLGVYVVTNEFYAYAYSPILQGFGGDLIDRSANGSARGVLDGARSVAAMTRFQSWFKRGWSRAIVDRNNDFELGRAAMSWTGHWKYAAYRKALGDDLILLPLPNFGHGIKTAMGSWSWGITSTCPSPAGAWRFLSYLLSVKEILRMTDTNGAVPGRKSALQQSPLYGPHGPLHVYAEQLLTGAGVPRPLTPGYGTISKAFSKAVSAIVVGQDVQTALTHAAIEIDQDVTENHGFPP
jgi:multiple sugar transport system substrate-binding protein